MTLNDVYAVLSHCEPGPVPILVSRHPDPQVTPGGTRAASCLSVARLVGADIGASAAGFLPRFSQRDQVHGEACPPALDTGAGSTGGRWCWGGPDRWRQGGSCSWWTVPGGKETTGQARRGDARERSVPRGGGGCTRLHPTRSGQGPLPPTSSPALVRG